MSIKTSQKEVLKNLEEMCELNLIVNRDDLWALKNESLDIRINNLERNSRLLKISKRMGWLIGKFPFVKGVYLSGSLSKLGANNDDADIDYFIITKNNRIWTARLVLIIFKRLFLFNSLKYFCTNYFIDENHLELNKKNIYTAIESASLMALQNKGLLGKFIEKNPFIQDYFPNFIPQKADSFNYSTFSRWRVSDPSFGTGDQRINNFWGDWIENNAREIIKKRMLKVHQNKNSDAEISEIYMGAWYSDIQDRVLENYNEKKLV
ncbi:hypothetical protein N9L36_00355 [Schleiferiaceae bacterium]|nr:hypothetical protein [Schleiferiaceae bacterium]